jgi:hypothetical protein
MYLSLWLALVLAGPAPPQNPAEMATREEPATFKARVNRVPVPVVVRDRQGRALLVRLDVRHLASAKRMDGTGTIWDPVRTSFDVKRGSYMIPLVVSYDEGQLMAAGNGAVEIP